jgi:DNA-3-methyladenine glycosylase
MDRTLPPSFYERDTLTVARELLGMTLVVRKGMTLDEAVITETEAYIGPEDLACHAAKGRTPRTEAMFGPAGRWYVYFVYGMHWMLNVVTREEGFPAAVLIRGVDGTSGPGRVAKRFGIDRALYGMSAIPVSGLWIEDRGVRVTEESVARTPRIGVAYAQEWAEKPYRFLWKPPHALKP